jgi:hypothetical protein
MQGHFDLTMLNTPGLTRDLIEAVRREGGDPAVEGYLRKFAKEDEWKTDNLIFQTTPSILYYHTFTGPSIYGANPMSWGGLVCIILTNTASEPTYNGEVYVSFLANWDAIPDTAGIGAGRGKRFINDCIVTPDFKVDSAGRESIYGKFKWLYLPGEGTSSVIKSVTLYGAGNDPASGAYFFRTGRVRIKDSGGNPVTISKVATKSLLVEYTFTMPTL